MSKLTIEAILSDDEWNWLSEQAKSQSLPDEGKAFRCCINFLSQQPTEGAEESLLSADGGATNEHRDFNQSSNSTSSSSRRLRRPISLAPSQLNWLQATAEAKNFQVEVFAGSVVRICQQNSDPDTIFGVIRCKNATRARGEADVAGYADETTVCDGAQEAVAAKKEVTGHEKGGCTMCSK